MRKAFTFIELIFVIVIIGIMTSLGLSAFKTNYLLNDVEFIASKIKEAQFLGTGYEHNGFGSQNSTPDYNAGCIKVEKTSLEENATNKKEVNYKLHVEIEVVDGGSDILCFDSKGRPHMDDFTTSSLITTQKQFKFSYNGKIKYITIEPITGYAIISG